MECEKKRRATTTAVESSTRLVSPRERSRAITVREWGKRWLDDREREGLRSIRSDRARWRTHVETAPWIDLPLKKVTRAMGREWLLVLSTKRRGNPHHKRRPIIAAQTMRNALHLIRVAFEDAIAAGLIEENIWTGLKVKRSRHARTTERSTVARPLEQETMLAALRTPERWMVAFALGSCMRREEMWTLRISDVEIEDLERPHVMVGRNSPTKGGEPRRVPLFGLALEAMYKWLEALPKFAPHNPLGLVFPRANGAQRKHTPAKLIARMRKALGRYFRWHDLRHSGATSLHLGWWGKEWPLRRVQRLLGHKSILTTERYTRYVDEEGLDHIARATEVAMANHSNESGKEWSRGGSNHKQNEDENPREGVAGSGEKNLSSPQEIAFGARVIATRAATKALVGAIGRVHDFDFDGGVRVALERERPFGDGRLPRGQVVLFQKHRVDRVADEAFGVGAAADNVVVLNGPAVIDELAVDGGSEFYAPPPYRELAKLEELSAIPPSVRAQIAQEVIDSQRAPAMPFNVNDRVRAAVRDAAGTLASWSKYVGTVRHVYREANDWRVYVTWDEGGSLETTADRLAFEVDVQEATKRRTEPERLGNILARAAVAPDPCALPTEAERFAAKRIARELRAAVMRGDYSSVDGMIERELVRIREEYAFALTHANELRDEMADREARALVKLRLATGALRDLEKVNVGGVLRELEAKDPRLILSTPDRVLEELGTKKGRER